MSNLRVKGTLGSDGRLYMTTDDKAIVEVVILQPGGLPVIARHEFGQGNAAHFSAARAARSLKKGAQVEAHGAALQLRRHQGADAIFLIGTDSIQGQLPTNFFDPKPAAIAA